MGKAKDSTVYANESEENFKAIKTSVWSCYETLNKLTSDELVELFERNGLAKVRELRLKANVKPGKDLCRIYSREILETEQIVALFQAK